jgi:hypothetical protein
VINSTPTHSNVYYLTPAEPVEAPRRPSRWSAFRTTLVRAWWRARITAAELRALVRRPRMVTDEPPLFATEFEPVARPRRRPSAPARVLDFASARVRLRPATQV